MIPEKDRPAVADRLKLMAGPVRLINFTQELECEFCRETRQLVEELASISDRLSVEVFNFVTDRARAEELKVDKIPATIVLGAKDFGIRFYGIPSGYEFSTLLDDIIAVSKGASGLTAANQSKVQAISDPLHLQVFVTPT